MRGRFPTLIIAGSLWAPRMAPFSVAGTYSNRYSKVKIRAYTGGPCEYSETDVALARRIYKWHLHTYKGAWGCMPDADLCTTFKQWSRADAAETNRYARQEAF